MSENNNTNNTEKKNSADDLFKQVSGYFNQAVDIGKKAAGTIVEKLDIEKQKAEIRSEIGHNSREVSRLYEQLGRDYFTAKEKGTEIEKEAETFDHIRSKEKLIELLNEKLDGFDK